MPKLIVAGWVVAVLMNLAFWGFVVWAGIKLLNHFAG